MPLISSYNSSVQSVQTIDQLIRCTVRMQSTSVPNVAATLTE